ncbi:unnamed protein product, partial [Polarella glacialis]
EVVGPGGGTTNLPASGLGTDPPPSPRGSGTPPLTPRGTQPLRRISYASTGSCRSLSAGSQYSVGPVGADGDVENQIVDDRPGSAGEHSPCRGQHGEVESADGGEVRLESKCSDVSRRVSKSSVNSLLGLGSRLSVRPFGRRHRTVRSDSKASSGSQISEQSGDAQGSRSRPRVFSGDSVDPASGNNSSPESAQDIVAELIDKAVRHSGNLLQQTVRVRALQAYDTLAQAYQGSPKPDQQMPHFDMKVDPDNLLLHLPYNIFKPHQLALQQ